MDANQWSNYNQQVYGRMPHGTPLPGSVNRYDLQLLDQQSLGPGLGTLPPSLSPSHTALPTARPLGSLTPMAYSHPLHNMSQFLETVNPLQPSYASQSSYKGGVPMSQPGYPVDSYMTSHISHEPAMSRYLPPPSAVSPSEGKPVYTPNLHNSKDIASSYVSSLSSPGLTPGSRVNDSKGWGLSNFTPTNSSPFGNLDSYALGSYGSSPTRNELSPSSDAHSRVSSAVQRNPFQTDRYSSAHLNRPRSPPSQYHSMNTSPGSHVSEDFVSSEHLGHHSRVQQDSVQRGQAEDLRRLHKAEDVSGLSPMSLLQRDSRDPFLGHQGVERTPLSSGISSSPNITSRSPQNSMSMSNPNTPVTQPYIDSTISSNTRHKPLHAQDLYEQYNQKTPNQSGNGHTYGVSSSPLSAPVSHMSEMNYDPVSPAAPPAESMHNTNFSTISLQDLDSISSHTSNLLGCKSNINTAEQATLQDYSPNIVTPEKVKHKKSKDDVKQRRSKKSSLSENTHDTLQKPPQVQHQTVHGQHQNPQSHHHGQQAQHHASPVQQHSNVYATGVNSPGQPLSAYSQEIRSPVRPSAQFNPQGIPSPMQQSPISVGSPALPPGVPVTNPLYSVSTSIVHSTPPTIQAVADSTTVPKPKRARNRKKKTNQSVEHIGSDSSNSQANAADQLLQDSDFSKLPDVDVLMKTSPIVPPDNYKPGPEAHDGLPQNMTGYDLPSALDVNVLNGISHSEQASAFMESDCIEQTGILDNVGEDYCDVKKDSVHSVIMRHSVTVDEKCDEAENKQVFPDPSVDQSENSGKQEPGDDNESLSNQLIDAIMEDGDGGLSNQGGEPQLECKPITIPKAVTSELEFDEDFQHLVPQQNKPQTVDTDKDVPNSSSKEIKLSSGSGAFLSSFLSFIKGNKGETLSSVTQEPIQRPPLPKYIPEPPRIKVATVPDKEISHSTDVEPNGVASKEQKSGRRSGKMVRGRRKSLGKRSGSVSRGMKGKNVFDDDIADAGASDEEGADVQEGKVEETTPVRRQSSRRAKEVGKKRKYVDSDSEGKSDDFEGGEEVTYTSEEEVDYDSDKDPAWTPFAAEKRQSSGDMPRGRFRRGSGYRGRGSGRPRGKGRRPHALVLAPEWDLSSDPENTETPGEPVVEDSTASDPKASEVTSKSSSLEYQPGSYIIEKRDLTNYENYPIWRVSDGKMLQKFELIVDKGQVKHKSTFTYSSWSPLMYSQYQPVKVRLLFKEKRSETVEVVDEDRPKPPTDGSLERQYEDNPLVEHFNVYLQILLSQALEPGFLKAIHQSEDKFYLGHMSKVDEMILRRISSIEQRVKWHSNFKEAVKNRPHVRELDRPNLRQSCQACRDVRQPAIKSVHLFGDLYDSVELTDHAQSSAASSQEFLIGKTATAFLSTYHSLVHYKYNLYKRCLAKVNLVKESQGTNDNAEVLDSCLHNRAWVLKLFEDLKKLLEEP